jgi:REP element-mobilizing transposase RayT
MGRPLRVVNPDRYYFITNRCLMGQFLMRPDDESVRIILGILARAVVKHNVRVVCFVFMSNHFHLICRFPDYNMGEFMSQLTGQLSRRLNKLRDRSGPMFPKRYHDQMLMGEEAILDKVNYVVNNPVKDKLVADARDWPGVTSIGAQLSDRTVTGEWYNGTKYNRMKQSDPDVEKEDAFEEFSFELEVPSCVDGDTDTDRCEAVTAAITNHRVEIWKSSTGSENEMPDVLGAQEVLETSWKLRDSGNARRKWTEKQKLRCWSREAGAIKQFYCDHKEMTKRYRHAAELRKLGQYARFPFGMYPPGEATAWTPDDDDPFEEELNERNSVEAEG